MPVPFGFIAGTQISTPGGAAAIETVRPGDLVLAYDVSGAQAVPRKVLTLSSDTVDQLVAVDGGEVVLTGVTPGTSVWDAFEGTFRGAGSMSSAGELLARVAGATHVVAIEEIPERAAPGTVVWHLTLEGDEGTFFADGVLVRHLESR